MILSGLDDVMVSFAAVSTTTPAGITAFISRDESVNAVICLPQKTSEEFTGEIFVDLIHLQNHVVGNPGFSQEDVQLARHTTSNRVDAKPEQ